MSRTQEKVHFVNSYACTIHTNGQLDHHMELNSYNDSSCKIKRDKLFLKFNEHIFTYHNHLSSCRRIHPMFLYKAQIYPRFYKNDKRKPLHRMDFDKQIIPIQKIQQN